jgi:hypothetical protein
MDWTDVQLLDRVVNGLAKLGYYVKNAKYGHNDGRCLAGVYPLQDKNPLYSRDAEVFSGTIEQIACWMRGFQHRNDYLLMLKATNEKRIQDLEEKYVKKIKQRAMIDAIKDPDKKIDKHTKDLIKSNSK